MGKARIKVELNVNAGEVSKIGSFQRNRKRPILIKLIKWDKKMEIWRATRKFKGSNIWINARQTLSNRKVLIPHMNWP